MACKFTQAGPSSTRRWSQTTFDTPRSGNGSQGMFDPNEANFLRSIVERFDDDTPRLVYADWLEKHGEPKRAEFIRVQCELAQLGKDDPRRAPLHERQARLLADHR